MPSPRSFLRFTLITLCIVVLSISQAILAQNVTTIDGLRQAAIENRQLIQSLDVKVAQLHNLAIEKRLTTIETQLHSIDESLKVLQAWQEKFIWALFALALETIVRLVEYARSKQSHNSSSD